MRRPNAECFTCQKPIYKRPWELEKYERVFCSNKCRGEFDRKCPQTKTCKGCGKEFAITDGRVQFCGKDCFENYRRTHPEEYPGHGKGGTTKGSIPWNKGLETPPEVREKISQSLLKRSDENSGGWGDMTEEDREARRQRLSESIKARYAAGWMPKAGRAPKLRYVSPTAGEVLVDGSWELTVAEHFDSLGIRWKRNKARFPYHFEEKDRYYTPDFFLEDIQVYVEVKGYQTDKDTAKWKQFPHKLIVLRKAEILEIRNSEMGLDRILECAYN